MNKETIQHEINQTKNEKITKEKNHNREPLWVAIRLSHFPLESLNVQRHNTNIMVSYKNHICATTDNLHAQGIERGTPTSTAQLLYIPNEESPLRIYERECDTEEKALSRICDALYNITPHIETYAVNAPNGCEDVGLLLEISRCIALFKGVKIIVGKISEALKTLKFSFAYALGHNKNIAWLLSYREKNSPNPTQPTHSPQHFIEALKPLPLDYLYEYQDAISQLKKTGFFCFGDLIFHIEQSSFHSLRKRFGENFSQHLSETLDIDNCMQQRALFKKPAVTYKPKQLFIESIQFDYPISNCEQLEHPVKTLLTALTDELVKNQEQTQNVCWNLYDIYHQHIIFSVHFERLHNDTILAQELTMIQLENQPLPFEVDTLELRCENVLPVHFENRSTHNDLHHDPYHNLHCDSHDEVERNAIAIVTSKLNARLGENSVLTLSPKDSHIPELTFTKTPMASAQNLSPEVPSATKTDRPSWIFNIPIKIGKRQNTLYWKGNLELQQGPERIEGLWWKKPTGRDYFVAKRDDHVRLWVFHDLYKNAWFVQGVFA